MRVAGGVGQGGQRDVVADRGVVLIDDVPQAGDDRVRDYDALRGVAVQHHVDDPGRLGLLLGVV